jgi:hypothetical protein
MVRSFAMTYANYRLGKLPAKHLAGLPLLFNYTKKLPLPPVAADHSDKLTTTAMFLNDQLGCCTVSAIGASIELWTSAAQAKEVVLPDSLIKSIYETVSGYDGDPSTDNGAACADVLRYWFDNPAVIGHKLTAFASVRPAIHNDIKNAVSLFGVAYIGIQLPLTAQDGPWQVIDATLSGDSEPGSWGGHCIPIIAYDANSLTCLTWGAKKEMSWDFWNAYCDEAFALLGQDWISIAGLSPDKIDLAELKSDMQSLR